MQPGELEITIDQSAVRVTIPQILVVVLSVRWYGHSSIGTDADCGWREVFSRGIEGSWLRIENHFESPKTYFCLPYVRRSFCRHFEPGSLDSAPPVSPARLDRLN